MRDFKFLHFWLLGLGLILGTLGLIDIVAPRLNHRVTKAWG